VLAVHIPIMLVNNNDNNNVSTISKAPYLGDHFQSAVQTSSKDTVHAAMKIKVYK